jgi:hypothetical protein
MGNSVAFSIFSGNGYLGFENTFRLYNLLFLYPCSKKALNTANVTASAAGG